MNEEILVMACAKINIGLQVFPCRNDGFHEIQSIFQTVRGIDNFYDLLIVRYDSEADFDFKVECKNLVLPRNNTLRLAFDAFCKVTKIELKGISVELQKKIPSGGGLGGGSSDGASLTKALEKIAGIVLNNKQLNEIASLVGSDVFFFIHSDFKESKVNNKILIEEDGCALVSGRGELVKKISKRKDLYFVLVFPDVFSSTKEAYNLLDKLLDLNFDLCYSNFTDFETMYNDFVTNWRFVNSFTNPLADKYSEIKDCLTCIKQSGALYAEMSGSGSTCYGVYATLTDAENANVKMAQQGFRCAVVK